MSNDELLAAFEAGEIDGGDFPHERHVRVAWALAQRYEEDEAFAHLVNGIRRIAARAGRPVAYHETITRALELPPPTAAAARRNLTACPTT